MFDGVLKRLQGKVRSRQYVATIHADEEMDDDGLTILDVESAILNGRIIERQRDRRTREWKYVLRGPAVFGALIGVVVKLSPPGKAVIITAYRE